jgi:hypothetical protein
MRCIQCHKEVDPEWDVGCIFIGCDGDFACSQKCHENYMKEREDFFNNILPDDKKFAQWLGGVR